jgi:hypothetical protein
MTEMGKRSAIRSAEKALEPGEEIKAVFLAPAVKDRDALVDEVKRRRAGGEPKELPFSSQYDLFAAMASDRNLYVFGQTGKMQRGIGAAANVAATGDLVPLDTSSAQKYALGTIEVTRDGKRIHIGDDLTLKVVLGNRKDADAFVDFVRERG